MRSATPLFLGCLLALGLSGCVSRGHYDLKAAEAEQLQQLAHGLEIDYQQLLEHRDQLASINSELGDKLTKALQNTSAQQQDLLRARADLERLEGILSARSAETGATLSQLRQNVDRLEEENRELKLLVEQERVAREARVAELKSTYDDLVGLMDAEIKRGEVTISELQGQLTVNMVDRILFDSGKADIKPGGLEVLRRVGGILKGAADKNIQVEGHTDNVPISPRLKETFPSNWELSTTRATTVLRFLQDSAGIDGSRLSATGFGQYRPQADNDTPEGRSQNRRIQIVLVPKGPAQDND
ncbi:MAG: OmpA/MotB family protein [Trichloromonadaceae bacterium]